MKDLDKIKTIFTLEVEKLYKKAMDCEKALPNEDLRKLEVLAAINKTLDNKLMDNLATDEVHRLTAKDVKDLINQAPKPKNDD
jgi:hypothetical protein